MARMPWTSEPPVDHPFVEPTDDRETDHQRRALCVRCGLPEANRVHIPVEEAGAGPGVRAGVHAGIGKESEQ
jgi:hypothetical protein